MRRLQTTLQNLCPLRQRLIVIAMALHWLVGSAAGAGDAMTLSYSGRLTEASGAPMSGPVEIRLKFWNAPTDGNQLGPTFEFSGVTLSQGAFTVSPQVTGAQAATIFGDGTTPVYAELLVGERVYPRQQYTYAPLALRVPVDGKTVAYDADGHLTLPAGTRPTSNSYLTTDSSGRLQWGTPTVSGLAGQQLSSTVPNAGQVLTYNGSSWTPVTPALANTAGTLTVEAGGTGVSAFTNNGVLVGSGALPVAATAAGAQHQVLTVGNSGAPEFGPLNIAHSAAVTGLLPLSRGGTGTDLSSTGGAGKYLKQSSVGATVSVGTIPATDITTSLGYTPLNKAGDTLGGALNFASNDLSDAGNVKLAAAKTLGLGVFDATSEPSMVQLLDASGQNSLDKGKMWFNKSTNQIKFWDGSSAVSLGVSGAGLQSLNGQIGSGQSFQVVASGTAPSITSASNVHTLSIPLAAASGVTAGLVSHSEFTALSGKPDAVAGGTGVGVANSSGTAIISLLSVGTAGTYVKVITNASGQVSAATTLDPVDIPNLNANKVSSGLLSVANGGTGVGSFTNGGVVVGSSGMLSSTAAGIGGNALIVGSSGPEFGPINLAANTAVSGLLPTSHGGTGVNSTAIFPTSGTLVTRDATETLLNKTLTTATINGSSTIGGASIVDTSGTIAAAAVTAHGDVAIVGNGSQAKKLILHDSGSANYLAIKAPDSVAAPVTLVLPATDGAPGQVIATNGSGQLSWTSGMPPVGGASGDLTGSYPALDLTQTGIAVGTYTKLVMNTKGRASNGTTLSVPDIPPLPASIVNSGELAIANGGTGAASAAAAFNALSPMTTAGDIIYGGASGAGTRLAGNTTTTRRFLASTGSGSAANAPQWNTISATDLPAHSAALITSGQIAVSNGGTGLGSAPSNGQLLIGTGSGYALAGLTAGTGIQITNASGAITVAATADAATKVAKSGDTMTGALVLPSNGLSVGSSQVVVTGGNVGLGTTAPQATLAIYSGSGTISTPQNTAGVEGLAFASYTDTTSSDLSTADIIASRNSTASNGGSQLRLWTQPRSTSAPSPRLVVDMNGNVGVGTTAPTAKLQVAGQIVSSQTVVASGATADFANGNVQVLQNVGASAITLNNMQDGGAYTLIISDATSRTYTFSTCTNAHWLYANGPTTANTRTMYTIIKTTESSATHCYISWITGL